MKHIGASQTGFKHGIVVTPCLEGKAMYHLVCRSKKTLVKTAKLLNQFIQRIELHEESGVICIPKHTVTLGELLDKLKKVASISVNTPHTRHGIDAIDARLNWLYENFPPYNFSWVVSYSGGKDSTLLLMKTLEFSQRKGFQVTVLHECTGMEIPQVQFHINDILCAAEGMGARVVRLQPPKNFFTIMLERGYSFPNWRYRWCCRIFKEEQARRWLSSQKRVLNLVAIRGDESRRVRGFVYTIFGIPTALPLIDLSVKQVWELLRQFPEVYSRLRNIYADSTESSGCWPCTAIRRDLTLKRLDPQLYEIKCELARARCKGLNQFLESLRKAIRLRPDAFQGFIEPDNPRDVRCGRKWCSKCFTGLWSLRYH